MGSIDMGYFLNMNPARLMIKIGEFSYHVHHFPSDQNCNCQEYLNLCIDAAREVWDYEKKIFFLIVHCIDFNFIERNLSA